ncbi:MAG TPA: hypothetical protein VEC57_15435 [Candidatus Limnocylindrales bacterium]|nr:hypothetical protein [Candidatus Limnocylindrales bacterium]
MTTKAAIVHVAMTMAAVTYAAVTFVLQRQWSQEAAPATEPPPAIVFFGVAAAATAIAWWMRSRLPPADGAGAEAWRNALDQAARQDKTLAEDLAAMSEQERLLVGFGFYATTRLIVVWAMAESVAIVGMARALLTHDATVLVPFLAISLALLMMTSPRLSQRIAEARRQAAAISSER